MLRRAVDWWIQATRLDERNVTDSGEPTSLKSWQFALALGLCVLIACVCGWPGPDLFR